MMIFIGVGVGVVGGVVAARLLESYVPGVRSIEPATFALMVGGVNWGGAGGEFCAGAAGEPGGPDERVAPGVTDGPGPSQFF